MSLKQSSHTLRLYWISHKRSLKGFWGGGTAYVGDTETDENWEGEGQAKDFYFQFDDSDADFFYLD